VSSALVALAVVLRLAWVLLVPTRPVGDFALYLESAAHLLEHRAFDAEFIYMPGYVFLLAGVQALGGGLLAAKLLGVAFGGLGAWAVFRIAQRLFDRRAAVVATTLYAGWPAGIAVSSVTGTDMPAAALLALAVAALVGAGPHDDGRRRRRVAVGFGALLGLAAYVRAVALPLALLALPYWLLIEPGPRARRVKAALGRTALGCLVAFLVLLPWGVRNRLRYGEFFVTDSHGGHTALVGSNPNSEGVYSRSLNQMFWKGTGYRLFDPSPRDADRAAYRLARSWAAFEPAYAAGLIAAKADRLLTHERNLLYWPVYRSSVLRDPPLRWFERHRAGIERLVDGFWYLLAAAALAGWVVTAARRRFPALAVTLFPLALVALYATFFSEVRYHLAIAIFMFPLAGQAAVWLVERARAAASIAAESARPAGARLARSARQAIAVALAVASLFLGWPRWLDAGAALRDRHRWAVCVCRVTGRTQLCNWRALAPAPGEGPSPVRGVWDGVGLRVGPDRPGGRGVASAAPVAAATAIDLPPGRYRVRARADRPGPLDRSPAIDVRLRAAGRIIGEARLPSPAGETSAALDGSVEHAGGILQIELRAQRITPDAGLGPSSPLATEPAETDLPTTVWLADIRIEPDLR
jgi:4-amino-4-deoxy-L-arabinose transferase-like glycosyltransferase